MAEKRKHGRQPLGWQVHEATARGLCRLAFVCMGLLPLAACLVWSGLQLLPAYQRMRTADWEAWLSAQLGVDIALTAFEARAPQRYTLHGLHLIHPETGASIGHVRAVQVERRGQQWAIDLDQPQLEEQQMAAGWRIVHDWFMCRPQRYRRAAQIGMQQLTIRGPGRNRQLTDISLQLFPGQEALLVHVGFRLADPTTMTAVGESAEPPMQDSSEPAKLIIRRQHARELAMTELQLKTGSTPLPCDLMAGWFPSVKELGEDAHFSGVLNLDLPGQGLGHAWRARVTQAQVTQLDLGRLTRGSPVGLSGTGTLAIERLAINHRQLEFARCGSEIRTGQMSRPLLDALGRHLDLAIRPMNTVDSYGFDSLKFGFDIDPHRLLFWGLVQDAHGALASRDPSHWQHPLPLERIVQVLAACGSGDPEPRGVEAFSSTWLAKQALAWLPLGPEQIETAQHTLRLSQSR